MEGSHAIEMGECVRAVVVGADERDDGGKKNTSPTEPGVVPLSPAMELKLRDAAITVQHAYLGCGEPICTVTALVDVVLPSDKTF